MSRTADRATTGDTVMAALPFSNSHEQLLAALAYVDLRVRWAVLRARAHGLNPDDEFRGLYISETQVDALLEYDLGHSLWPASNGQKAELAQWPAILADARRRWQARTAASLAAGCELRLDNLVTAFELTPLEIDAFLITLAPELDPRYERLFAYLQDDVTKKRPAVDLVLNLLTDSFQEKLRLRRLFYDDGRLLQSRLLVCFADGSAREPTLLAHYLRPASRVVEHLLGHSGVDQRLANVAWLSDTAAWQASPAIPSPLADEQIARLLRTAAETATRPPTATPASGRPPLFAFNGSYGAGKRETAHRLARAAGQPLLTVDLAGLAKEEADWQDLLRLICRDGRLAGATLYLTGWDALIADNDHPPPAVFRQLLDYPHTVIVAGTAVWQPAGRVETRPVVRTRFDLPEYEQRRQVWQSLLPVENLDLSGVANQFHFTPGQIADAVATARDLAFWRDEAISEELLFIACRDHSNQRLSTLAAKIRPRYRWDDIVLPADTRQQLQEMVNMVRQRPLVYGEWGFDRKLALGKGLNALFAGESGTGKTMAADIMAGQLGLDLYKIDLSTLVSKYIGETEKNLNRIFTEAATSNAILFFDEADAIFGKRSEVKDSHDRYANIEISYLLQRMEAYDGVVILATNMRSNLDDAFTRRLHFIIEFPFPEAADREIIWQVNFPPETPLAGDIDYSLLAQRFRLAGGNIRNIIMAAAFLAAEAGEVVALAHLLHATRREYQKMGRLIDEALFIVEG
jgi:AAA+ superfamily predicted ATPase